jgi:hypothetical protein
MVAVILTHLGESVPFYIADCVHQLRLWNPTTPLYIILERFHEHGVFWNTIRDSYNVRLVYTDTLLQTEAHKEFQSGYKGDTEFRKGYWKHVKERFYFVEELIIQENITDAISMEYDVLVYGPIDDLIKKLHNLPSKNLRMVMDNDERGHPAFLYIPTASDINQFNTFLASITDMPLEDMQSLSMYSRLFPSSVSFFPVITEARNRSVPLRVSKSGHSVKNPYFLSQDSESIHYLFDSLVVGQWVGGIDSRNTRGHKITRYMNEGALYNIKEMPFEWIKTDEKWVPMLDNRRLFTIHVHSKALMCFLSDRKSMPSDDYDVRTIHSQLLPD